MKMGGKLFEQPALTANCLLHFCPSCFGITSVLLLYHFTPEFRPAQDAEIYINRQTAK